jgi:hypothetical protein
MANASDIAKQLTAVQAQKDKLVLQLEEKRRENAELEERLAGLEESQADYAHTLLCVRRLWDQLDADVVALVTDAELLLDDGAGPAGAEGSLDSARLATVKARDPFLGALLQAAADPAAINAAAAATADISCELSDVEAALHERSRASQKALASLLHIMRQGLQRRIAAQAQGSIDAVS